MGVDLQNLNPEARQWLLHATAGMVAADGEVSEAEMNRLREALASLGDEVETAVILDQIQNPPVPDLEPIALEKKEAFEVLKDLMQLAAVDGELSGSEAKFLEHVAELLGFPPEVADKLNKMAGEIATTALRAQFEVRGKNIEATCLRLNKGGMVAITQSGLAPEASVMIRFYDRSAETGKITKLFMPFSARVQTSQKHPQEKNSFVLQVEFLEKLTINNGVRPLLFPKHYERGTASLLPSIHLSLEGYLAECRICGKREVTIWEPKPNVPKAEKNMFGLEMYTEAKDNGNNLSLYKVAICPGCLFATPFREYFYKPGDPVHPSALLNSRKFQTRWMTTAINRKRDLGYDFSWLDAKKRSDEQGMQAWELAVGSHEMLVENSQPASLQQEWHMVLCMMERTALLSQQGKHRAGNGYLQRVIVRIETFLENLSEEEKIEPLRLLALLELHEENEHKFEKYLQDMKNLLEHLADNSESQKQSSEALRCLQDADANRNLYFKTKRQNYYAPVIPDSPPPTEQKTETPEDKKTGVAETETAASEAEETS